MERYRERGFFVFIRGVSVIVAWFLRDLRWVDRDASDVAVSRGPGGRPDHRRRWSPGLPVSWTGILDEDGCPQVRLARVSPVAATRD